MSTKPSAPSKGVKEKDDIKKKRCSDISFAQFLSILRQTFPDMKFGDERKADFEKFQKYDTEVGFAINRIRRHLKDESIKTEDYDVVIFGATDLPRFETDENDEDKVKAIEPWKINMPTLFLKEMALGRIDLRAKSTYDRHGIVFNKKGKVALQRQIDKNGKYDDLLWISHMDDIVDDFNVEEVLKKFAIPPEYVTGDLFLNADNKSTFPTMVLYGKIGTIFLGKDFESESAEKHMPIEITNDHTAENPCFGFTLFTPNVDADNRSCLVSLGKQWFGRLIFQLKEGNLIDIIKKIQSSDIVKDKLGVVNTKLIEDELNSMISGMTVFIVGNPKKINEKNGRFTLNFNAVSVIETEWELDPKDYDLFMEEWRKIMEQSKPVNRKSSDLTPPAEIEKDNAETKEATIPKKDDIAKAREQREKVKASIKEGIDTLGENTDLASLRNGGYLKEAEGMIDEVINNIINKVKKENAEKVKPTEKPAETSQPSKEEKKEEKNIQEEKKETKNAEPVKKEEPKKTEEQPLSNISEVADDELNKLGKRIEEIGLGENASKIVLYIYSNDKGEGVEPSNISKELKIKPNVVSGAIKRMLEAKLLYSSSENHYSINF